MIEGKSLRDAEVFDNELARAVGKAPVLIVEAAKHFPRPAQIIRGKFVKRRQI